MTLRASELYISKGECTTWKYSLVLEVFKHDQHDIFCGRATSVLLIKTSLNQTITWENTPFGFNAYSNLMEKETTLEKPESVFTVDKHTKSYCQSERVVRW